MGEAPILHRNDQIHVISEMMSDSLVKQITRMYRDVGIKIAGWTELPGVRGIHIVSVIRGKSATLAADAMPRIPDGS